MQSSDTAAVTQFDDRAERTHYYQVADENLLTHPAVRALGEEISSRRAKVLDVGCGSGAFSTLLGQGCSYWGGDFETESTARRESSVCDATLFRLDACRVFPFDDRSFDYVISLWCLEHVPEPKSMLRECVRVLKPNGKLALIFPNYDNPLRRCPSYWCMRGRDDSLVSALRPFQIKALSCQLARRSSYVLRQAVRQMRLTLSRRYASFWINEDPAIKHLPWARDRDAIHVVSGQSVERFLVGQGMQIESSSRKVVSGLPVVDGFFDWSPEYVIRASRTAMSHPQTVTRP